MDDDKRALACLLKAHEADQNNLDVLLALGVSCTNNLDEDDAMKFLRRWIENNPKYQLKNLPQENNVENIINIFTQTSNSHNNSDPELLTVLSVLHFIDRDYDQAVHYFKASLKLDPSNYSLWNKLGATLAHLGHADEAM
jgi:peroxin-5